MTMSGLDAGTKNAEFYRANARSSLAMESSRPSRSTYAGPAEELLYRPRFEFGY